MREERWETGDKRWEIRDERWEMGDSRCSRHAGHPPVEPAAARRYKLRPLSLRSAFVPPRPSRFGPSHFGLQTLTCPPPPLPPATSGPGGEDAEIRFGRRVTSGWRRTLYAARSRFFGGGAGGRRAPAGDEELLACRGAAPWVFPLPQPPSPSPPRSPPAPAPFQPRRRVPSPPTVQQCCPQRHCLHRPHHGAQSQGAWPPRPRQ